MSLFFFEALEVALRPVLLVFLLLGLAVTIEGVAHLDVSEGKVKVVLYSRPDTSTSCQTFLVEAHELLRETVDLDVSQADQTYPQLAVQMIQDGADLGILCFSRGWQISVVGRSELEHQRFVRAAQLAAITLSRHEPWFIKVYNELFGVGTDKSHVAEGWPVTVNIANYATSPESHARVFLPKIVAMLSHFVAFGFACRSIARDLASNTLSTIVAASSGRWWPTLLVRASVATLLGLFALGFLLALAANRHGFTLTFPDITTANVQVLSLTAAAFLGLAAALLVRTEIRIMMIALLYFVFSFLFSGLISNLNQDQILLYSVSKSLPLSYAMDSLTNFMFFGASSVADANGLQNLLAANIAAVTFMVLIVYRLRRVQ